VGTLAHLQLTGEHEHGPIRLELDVWTNGVGQLFRGERRDFRRSSRGERFWMTTGCQCLRSNADRILDARVRATAAQVAIHPHRDLGGIRDRIRLQQRYRSERLPRLTVAALDDVAAIPCVADCVDHWPGDTLDRDDGPTDGSLSRGLAGFCVSSVDQDRARGAIADSATKLGSVHSKHVPQDPQQRCFGVAVINIHIRAVDGQPHGIPHSRIRIARSFAWNVVRRPHQILVI
jgi:hypothetical protein